MEKKEVKTGPRPKGPYRTAEARGARTWLRVQLECDQPPYEKEEERGLWLLFQGFRKRLVGDAK